MTTTIKIDLKAIEIAAKEFTTVESCKKALRSIQSQKCRLQKQKSKSNYDQDFAKLVLKEQLLKEVRSYLEPKKITVTTMTAQDISLLTHDQTIKAIKSIQSKKCLEQFNPDQAAYQAAVATEQMLLAHKQQVKPLEDTVVAKSKVNDLLAELQNLDSKISKEYILQQLKNLL